MSEEDRKAVVTNGHPSPDTGDESEWRLKSIIEGTNVGSWEWNVQTGETRFNERWAEIIGYTLDELGPTTIETWAEYAHPDDLAGSNGLLERHFAGELSHYDIECRMRHRDGHWVWVHDRGRVFSWTEDGKPEWMFGTHQDITERKRAEEERVKLERQLLKAQKMESLGVLAGGIAHDFNNILGAIRGYTELTLLDLPWDSVYRDYLNHVVGGIERANRLTNQMLAYSGRGNFVVGPIDLPSLVGETVTLTNRDIPGHASVRVTQDDGVPEMEGDQVQLKQLVRSLLENAVDALHDEPGLISLHTGAMEWREREAPEGLALLGEEFGYPEPGRYVYFEISDTGVGMTADVQRRFLEPFFSTKFQGRGLGMAAAQGIVRAHRGGVMLRSVPGEGTRIRVLFPASSTLPLPEARPASPAQRTAEELGDGPPLKGRTVLVVDDEPHGREMCAALLRELGAVVRTADGGEMALADLRNGGRPADVVLLDVTMPGIDGHECLRQIRQLRTELPVVLMSGFSEGEVSRRQGEVAPDGFIQKPFSLAQLTDALVLALA